MFRVLQPQRSLFSHQRAWRGRRGSSSTTSTWASTQTTRWGTSRGSDSSTLSSDSVSTDVTAMHRQLCPSWHCSQGYNPIVLNQHLCFKRVFVHRSMEENVCVSDIDDRSLSAQYSSLSDLMQTEVSLSGGFLPFCHRENSFIMATIGSQCLHREGRIY